MAPFTKWVKIVGLLVMGLLVLKVGAAVTGDREVVGASVLSPTHPLARVNCRTYRV
jgi:hypothetical protein